MVYIMLFSVHNFENDREKLCFETNNKEIAQVRTHFWRQFCLGENMPKYFDRSIMSLLAGGVLIGKLNAW